MTALLAAVLALQGGDEEIRAALKKLTSDYLEERAAAVQTLAAAGPRAEPFLIEALASEASIVRLHAIRLLEKIGSRKPVEIVGAIFRSAPGAELQEAAFDYLKKFPDAAEAFLVPALEHELLRIRKEALEALRKNPGPGPVPTVARLYGRERDAALKEAAFNYLVAAGAHAEAEMLKLLANPEAPVRAKVIQEGLKNSSSEAVVRAVGELFLKEPDAAVLSQARDLLDRLYAQAGGLSERLLIRALEEGTAPGRKPAVEVLAKQKSAAGVAPAGRLLAATRDRPLLESLARYLEPWPEAAPALHEAAKRGELEAAVTALELLERRKDYGSVAAAVERYRPAAGDGLRSAAVAYLCGSKAREAEPALVSALEDRLPAIRSRAIEGLGALQTPGAIGALARRLKDVDPQDQSRIYAALGRFKADALRAILASGEAAAIPEETRERLRDLHARVALEEALDGFAGTYPGQFKELGGEVVDAARVTSILKEMVGPDYRGISEGGSILRRRSLAALALAELAGAAEALRPVWEGELAGAGGLGRMELRIAFAAALGRAGQAEPAAKLGGELAAFAAQQRTSGAPAGAALAAEADSWRALLLARTGARKEALALYEAAVGGVTPKDAVYYNIACLKARLGDKSGALAALGRAVEAGFKDRAWILRDADLESLRALPEFKAIVESLPP